MQTVAANRNHWLCLVMGYFEEMGKKWEKVKNQRKHLAL